MRWLKAQFLFAIVLASTADAQTIAPPQLPNVINTQPVNPSGKPSVAGLPSDKPSARGIFEDALVRDKTMNSVYADLIKLPEFKALKLLDVKKSYAQKYMTDRSLMLIESAKTLVPFQFSTGLSDTDKKHIDSFATEVAEGKFKVRELTVSFDLGSQLGAFIEFLNTEAAKLPMTMPHPDQEKQLESSGVQWLVDHRILKPEGLNESERRSISKLSLLVLSKKWAAEVVPAAIKPPLTESPNRIAAHQPVLENFLKFLPQTLLSRGGVQPLHQIRDQMLEISLKAIEQHFLGSQTLTDEERQQLVQIVDQAMKPMENLIGQLVSPNLSQLPPSDVQPIPNQPTATQIVPMQPIGNLLNPTFLMPWMMNFNGFPGGHGHHVFKTMQPSSGFMFRR